MPTAKRERQKAARRQKIEEQNRSMKRKSNLRRGLIAIVVLAVVFGSTALLFHKSSTTVTLPSTTTTSATASTDASLQKLADEKALAAGCPASYNARVNTMKWSSAPAMTINTAKTYDATFSTTAGTFVVQLNPAEAPITVNNFVFLAEHKFYNCVIFQRVIPGFMIQGGDPTGTGTGGPGYTIADEFPKAGKPTYPLYSIAMANTGAAHSGGSQFFIVTGTTGETLSPSYSLFGKVISGQSVVQTISNEGNSSSSSNGMPPLVTNRMLSVMITEN